MSATGWRSKAQRGSDQRTSSKVWFFETESIGVALLWWAPLTVGLTVVTLVIHCLVWPLRFLWTVILRTYRITETVSRESDEAGDFSDAVRRARLGHLSPGPLPRATASWLLDPRTKITQPLRPELPPRPSLEHISVMGLRTEALVIPSVGGSLSASTRSRSRTSPSATAADASPGTGSGVVVMVVFPGNPGCVSFYEDFLQALSGESSRALTIVCVGQAGHSVETATERWPWFHAGAAEAPVSLTHDPTPQDLGSGWWPGAAQVPETSPDLVTQTEHKAAFIADLVQSDPTIRIILAGHSIGAWQAIDCARAIPKDNLAGVVGLFPTVELIGDSLRGRALFPIFRFLAPSIARIADLVSMLPAPTLRFIATQIMGPTASQSAVHCVPLIASGEVCLNALRMAYHEMKEMGTLDKDAYADFETDLVLLYGQVDHWNNPEEFRLMKKRLSKASVLVDEAGHSHSYCLHVDACLDTAAETWRALTPILSRKGVQIRVPAPSPTTRRVTSSGGSKKAKLKPTKKSPKPTSLSSKLSSTDQTEESDASSEDSDSRTPARRRIRSRQSAARKTANRFFGTIPEPVSAVRPAMMPMRWPSPSTVLAMQAAARTPASVTQSVAPPALSRMDSFMDLEIDPFRRELSMEAIMNKW
jgi:pimeloyl-ACP methyl ester carboxylesterase